MTTAINFTARGTSCLGALLNPCNLPRMRRPLHLHIRNQRSDCRGPRAQAARRACSNEALAISLPLASVAGAVVADAASLGIHWIYDKEKMSAAVPAGTNPEFRPIQTTWHAARTAGDTTMYGEGALLMAKTLVAKGGVYKEAAFKSAWYAAFGPCGTYSGYADKTTRLSVYNMMKLQVEHEKDTWPAPGLDPRVQAAMMPVFRSLAEDHSGDALTHAALDVAKKAAPDADAASLAWVEKAADAWDTILHTPIGAHDDQSSECMCMRCADADIDRKASSASKPRSNIIQPAPFTYPSARAA